MDRSPNGAAGTPVLAAIVIVILLALSACTATPPPRSYAQPGVPSTYTRQMHDAAYYTGADPAFPRTGKASGGGSGGE
ncbi:hypothetical protein E2C06_24525 [Dankookia rubra]|uniref:Lipoprotein n=1 Tax=Dankookia rubra TaxID=1442381 RepID=A0A4R5QAY1_9PROT|nr:hypothetical protein [Dankookia rubra]TDH59966.1 hypothetical protein E2C06_24525 [Dankookia rubra]